MFIWPYIEVSMSSLFYSVEEYYEHTDDKDM
jgi:hypothetical protein